MSVKGKFTISRKGFFVPREAVGMKAGLNFVRVQTGSRENSAKWELVVRRRWACAWSDRWIF